MIVAAVQQASLTDAPPASAISAATGWASDLIFGPLATSIAVIAIAWIGFAMLIGRIDIRRGLWVVIGCFLLFGARGITDGLRSVAASDANPPAAVAPPPPSYAKPPARRQTANAFDPYAGGTVVAPGN
jgi:type IV secretion system protein VirB2